MTSTPATALAIEHAALTSGAAFLDRSDRGRIEHHGADALDLLHRLTTNDIESLQPGQARDTILASDRGRIIDVFTVLRRHDRPLLLLTSSVHKQRLVDQIDFYTIIEHAELEDISSQTAQLSLTGPRVSELLSKLAIPQLPPGSHATAEIAGHEVTVLHTSADPACELITPADAAAEVTAALSDAGFTPVGLQAFDIYRIEHAIAEAGRDFDERVNPLEAGFLHLIDFDKGCYVGQEVIARLDTYDKVQRRLITVRSDEMVAQGEPLYSGEREAGRTCTTATPLDSPGTIALAYARNDYTQSGTRLTTASGATVIVTPPRSAIR